MEKQEVINKIKEIIMETVDMGDLSDVSETENLVESKGLNSMDAISILVAVEDAFDIEIDDQDLSAELIQTIENISNYVIKKVEEND